MDLMIVAPTYDPHAQMVAWAAEKLGAESRIVDVGQLATGATLTHHTSDDAFVISPAPGDDIRLKDVKRLWIRRTSPTYFDARTHPDDLRYATQSWAMFVDSYMLEALGICRFVANDPASVRSAILKPFQLRQAMSVGLSVPATVVTNDTEIVRAFISSNIATGSDTIVKPLTHMKWQTTEGGLANANTVGVTLFDLEEANISSCPMIYQQAIEKDYEVRILVCGNSYIAARIDRQIGRAATDWRLGRDLQRLGCDRIEVPATVLEKVYVLMGKLGLVTSSLDFIVRPGGEWCFLESNEGGNFAWLEAVNPALTALDMFTKFILRGDRHFTYDDNPTVSLDAFDVQQRQYSAQINSPSHPNGGTRAVIEGGGAPGDTQTQSRLRA